MTLVPMPLAPAVRISALTTVLTYTKAKPAVKSDVRINSAEAWLASVLADASALDAQARRKRCELMRS
jgi:hypothetical protein